jgi:hypothetical protein
MDAAFGQSKAYQAVIVPEAATGHLEHDASIYDPGSFPGNEPHGDHHGEEHGGHGPDHGHGH